MAEPLIRPGDPVAIIGAGAVGITLGAALARAGHPLTVCGGRPIQSIRIADGDLTEVHPVHCAADPRELASHRFVLLAVKAQHTAAAERWLRATADPETVLVVAQNGIEHRERVSPYAGASRVVPAIVYIPAERPAPGHAIIHRPSDRDVTVPADAAALAVAERMRAGNLRVQTAADFSTAAWEKVLVNLASNPLTTLTGRRVEVLRDPDVAQYASQLLKEASSIGRAAGAAVDESHTYRTIPWLQGLPDGSSTSMLQDRLAGRELEHDALTGGLAPRRGKARHGCSPPAFAAYPSPSHQRWSIASATVRSGDVKRIS